MKARHPHLVPLSTQAVTILKELDVSAAAIDGRVQIQEAPRRRRRRELAGMESASAESVIADIREQFRQR
jgi:hypothetical protein